MWAKHGVGNTYVSSKRFVDWASPERFGEAGIKSVLGAGQDVALEALNLLELEFDDLRVWFEIQGMENAEKMAVKIWSPFCHPNIELDRQTLKLRLGTKLLDVACDSFPQCWIVP